MTSLDLERDATDDAYVEVTMDGMIFDVPRSREDSDMIRIREDLALCLDESWDDCPTEDDQRAEWLALYVLGPVVQAETIRARREGASEALLAAQKEVERIIPGWARARTVLREAAEAISVLRDLIDHDARDTRGRQTGRRSA